MAGGVPSQGCRQFCQNPTRKFRRGSYRRDRLLAEKPYLVCKRNRHPSGRRNHDIFMLKARLSLSDPGSFEGLLGGPRQRREPHFMVPSPSPSAGGGLGEWPSGHTLVHPDRLHAPPPAFPVLEQSGRLSLGRSVIRMAVRVCALSFSCSRTSPRGCTEERCHGCEHGDVQPWSPSASVHHASGHWI